MTRIRLVLLVSALVVLSGCGQRESKNRPATRGGENADPAAPERGAAEPAASALPAAVPGEYQLVTSTRGRPLSSQLRVRVTAGETTVSAPTGTAGTPFPAGSIALAQLSDRIDAYLTPPPPPAPAASGDGGVTKPEGELADRGFGLGQAGIGSGSGCGSGWGTIGTGHYGSIGRRTELAPYWISDHAPLLVADRDLPAQRAVEVVEALCHHGARLAVARPGEQNAAEHPIAVGADDSGHCPPMSEERRKHAHVPPPSSLRVVVELRKSGIRIVRSGKPAIAIARDGAALATALEKLRDDDAYQIELWIVVDDQVTVADLAMALDQAAAIDLSDTYLTTMAEWDLVHRGYGAGPRRSTTQVRIGSSTVVGDLPKEIIRRYLRRKLPQIKQCYDKQLASNPALEGIVTTDWVIDRTGLATAVRAEGVAPEVSACIAGIIESIRFPRSPNGGIVKVRYPLHFQPAGK